MGERRSINVINSQRLMLKVKNERSCDPLSLAGYRLICLVEACPMLLKLAVAIDNNVPLDTVTALDSTAVGPGVTSVPIVFAEDHSVYEMVY